jgi:hypothetical protein
MSSWHDSCTRTGVCQPGVHTAWGKCSVGATNSRTACYKACTCSPNTYLEHSMYQWQVCPDTVSYLPPCCSPCHTPSRCHKPIKAAHILKEHGK